MNGVIQSVVLVYTADVNECSFSDTCEQSCENKVRTFTCSCNTGYSTEVRTCTGKRRELLLYEF